MKINILVHYVINKMINIIGIVLLFSTCCKSQNINTLYKEKPDSGRNIFFTVGINLKFPDVSSDKLELKDFDSVYYDYAILKLPHNYSDTGTPVRLVWLAHKAGGGVTDSTWFWNRFSITDTLLKNGYACFDVNGGPLVENMGGTLVVQSAFKAYEYIRNNYNVSERIFVIGGSMGGLSSTNFIYRHSNIVTAHAMYCPVLDLYEQAWKNPWFSTTRQAIATAYDFNDKTGNKWDPEKVIGWDPLNINTFNNGIDTFKIYPVPVKIWHGIYDPAVRITTSLKFQKYIQNANGYCELRKLDSENHGLSCGNAYMNRELIMFFKRFDK